jgi:hypothetical protein
VNKMNHLRSLDYVNITLAACACGWERADQAKQHVDTWHSEISHIVIEQEWITLHT